MTIPPAFVAATAVLAAGCAPPLEVPQTPTWVDDIQPLLAANCFHCHGGGPRPPGAERWDFHDVADCPEIPVPEEIRSANLWGTIIAAFLDGSAELPRMPPLPASPLTARQRELFARWWPNPVRGVRHRNHLPRAEVVRWTRGGNRVELIIDIADGDREQVLGTLSSASETTLLLRTGRHTVSLAASVGEELRLVLCDGQDTVHAGVRVP